jgi:hypothetical protein
MSGFVRVGEGGLLLFKTAVTLCDVIMGKEAGAVFMAGRDMAATEEQAEMLRFG